MHEGMTAIICEVANGFRQYYRFREQRIIAGCSVRRAPGRGGGEGFTTGTPQKPNKKKKKKKKQKKKKNKQTKKKKKK